MFLFNVSSCCATPIFLISLLLPVPRISHSRSFPPLLVAESRAKQAWKLFDAMRSPAPPSSSSYCTQAFNPIIPHPNPSHQSPSPPSTDITSNNRRINQFLRSGLIGHALQLFDEMPDRDTVSWNSMIAGYTRAGSPQQAVDLYMGMLASGIKETPHTFPPLLGACSHAQGLQLHCRVVALGLSTNLFVGSAFVDLYMRAASPDLALRVFDGLPQRSTATCNLVLRGYCDLRLAVELLGFFLLEMRSEQGIEPDGVSFSYLIHGCCYGPLLDEGKQLHCHIIKAGFVPANLFLSNALVDLYSAAGKLTDARTSISCIPEEDVISWNSMVSVCADNGSSVEALGFFHRMLWHNKKPSVRSFVGLLNLSSRNRELHLGRQIHGFVLKMGFSSGSAHLQSALIDMYGKCFDIESSVLFFNEITDRGLECCNSLITSFLHCNLVEDVVEMFGLMVDNGVRPDHVSFSAALKALSSSSAASGCEMLHCCAVKSGVDSNEAVSCSLIFAYARSGHVHLCCQVFDRIEDPNLKCFSAMIAAYARNGMGKEGVQMFHEMIRRGLKPDDITFLSILAGCDHSGLVGEGQSVFERMKTVHGVEPDRRHYSCMVSLLGRAGLVEEAMELARAHHDPRMWSSLLHNCRVLGKEEVGRRAAEALMEMQPGDAAACLQVSSFYSEIADMEGSTRVREMLPDLAGREIGWSLVEVKGIKHL